MNEIFAVPVDGNFDLTIHAVDFSLTASQLERVSQLSIRSGANAFFDDPLNQPDDRRARFEAIYKVTASK